MRFAAGAVVAVPSMHACMHTYIHVYKYTAENLLVRRTHSLAAAHLVSIFLLIRSTCARFARCARLASVRVGNVDDYDDDDDDDDDADDDDVGWLSS